MDEDKMIELRALVRNIRTNESGRANGNDDDEDATMGVIHDALQALFDDISEEQINEIMEIT